MSFARNDEDMSEMIDTLGTESYGIWWIIIEMVAEQMDKSDKHSARFSFKKWSKSCGVSVKKFQKTVSFLSKLGKISAEQSEKYPEFLKISIPKLLNFRDEWSKRSGVTTEIIRSDSGVTTEQEAEAEAEAEDIPLPQNEFAGDDQKEFYLTKKKRKLTSKRLETFNRFWSAFDYKKGKADAADSWLDIPQLTDKLVNEICEAAKIEASNRDKLISEGRTPIFPQGWLTARRWEDELTDQGNKAGPNKSAQKSIERANKYIDS